MNAPFIVIEGIDGSGKSTLASQLKKYLGKRQRASCKIFNWFRNERYHRLAEVFNMTGGMNPAVLAAIHACYTESLLIELLASRCTLRLIDRYIYTSYAACVIRGESKLRMRKLISNFPTPALTVLIQLDPEICYDRLMRRGGITFYESGLDRLFQSNRRAIFFNRFTKGDISASLQKEVFIQTMHEWSELLSEVISSVPHVTGINLSLNDMDSLCKDVAEYAKLHII